MGEANQSRVSEFLLLGLSRQPQQQQLLFLLFLTMYLATVLGHLLILLAISRVCNRTFKLAMIHDPVTSRTQSWGVIFAE